MDYKEKIIDIAKKNNGIFKSSYLNSFNIPKSYLKLLIKSNDIERVERGIYILTDTLIDNYFLSRLKYSRSVLSHETALYFHKLSDRISIKLVVTFPSNYNTFNVDEKRYEVYKSPKNTHDIGKVEIKSPYGNDIVIYNMERTICDVIRNRENTDKEIFSEALKRYSQRKNKDLVKLVEYSEYFNIQEEVIRYMEVLL